MVLNPLYICMVVLAVIGVLFTFPAKLFIVCDVCTVLGGVVAAAAGGRAVQDGGPSFVQVQEPAGH